MRRSCYAALDDVAPYDVAASFPPRLRRSRSHRSCRPQLRRSPCGPNQQLRRYTNTL